MGGAAAGGLDGLFLTHCCCADPFTAVPLPAAHLSRSDSTRATLPPSFHQRLLVVAMHLRFGHVLLLMTSLSAAALAVAFTSVLHAALLQSGFSASLLRHPVNTEAIVDFLSQVPPQKLIFLFLTHSAAHVLLMLMLAANGLLLLGWIVQRALFADSVSNSEIKVARENTLHFAVFRLLFLGSILESTSSSGSNNAAGVGAESVPLAPGAGPLRELACWLMWFGVMGFLRWFLVLLRERFQTAQSSPYATVHTFTKYLLLTVAFSVANLAVALAVLFVLRPHTTWAVVSLLLFENVILLASCLKIIFRYALYIRTLQKEQPWEERGSTLYYSVRPLTPRRWCFIRAACEHVLLTSR